TVQSLKVRFDQKGHERPFQKAIIVDTIDGYLKPGDHIIIRMGDRRFGGPGTRAQTFVEKDFKFRCYVDPLGTSRFCTIPGDIVIDIVPGQPHHLEIVGSRLVNRDKRIPLKIRAEDIWGNTCWNIGGSVQIKAGLEGKKIYSKTVKINPKGWAVVEVIDLPSDRNGELIITATMPNRPAVAEKQFFITIDSGFNYERIYYGDLHVHSDDTVGTNDTRYNLTYGRDVAGLDVLGYTANDFQITKDRWDGAVRLINKELYEEGKFICYPGTEWCGNSCAGGDHNVIFLHGKTPEFPYDSQGNIARSFEWNEDMTSEQIEPGAWPLEELWVTYVDDPEGHLLMPHVGGRRCVLDWHHPVLERLIEIESAWGHFGWLYEEAMQRGYKLGASANGDEHRGRCGGGVPGTAVFGTKGGVTGIISKKLERKTISKSLRARHTFATTGERLVGLTQCGKFIQGDGFRNKGPAEITYRFLGDAGWDKIQAYDHTGLIWSRNLQDEAGYSDRRIRVRWGGARIKDRYRWAEWSGSIKILNGVVNSFLGRGFEHQEENCYRKSPTEIGFRTDTYGDADCVEMDVSDLAHCTIQIYGTIDSYNKVGNQLDRNPFIHCPEFIFEVSGADLIEHGELTKKLGGVNMFVSVERISDQLLPRDVQGKIQIDPVNGPAGFRPIFFLGRQIDDAKAWTSAMFIEFR
ncbi:MAG: hypothetical protein HKP41_03390, partial [Desulfobacterales bacterium]|nr:hypothetical protein [Desulfobacterales bacterium]